MAVFDFLDRMITLLPQRMGNYREESNTYKFLAPLAAQMTQLKTAFDDIEKVRDVDQATGVHLDVLARNVGLRRGSLNDEQLRRNIKVERQAQRSNGQFQELKEIAEIVLNHTVSVSEMWNNPLYSNEAAGVVLDVIADASAIQIPDPTIEKAVSGGVRLAIQATNTDETVVVQEPEIQVIEIISLQTGTFTLAQNMGSLF